MADVKDPGLGQKFERESFDVVVDVRDNGQVYGSLMRGRRPCGEYDTRWR